MEEHEGHGKSIFFLPPGARRRSGSHLGRLVSENVFQGHRDGHQPYCRGSYPKNKDPRH